MCGLALSPRVRAMTNSIKKTISGSIASNGGAGMAAPARQQGKSIFKAQIERARDCFVTLLFIATITTMPISTFSQGRDQGATNRVEIKDHRTKKLVSKSPQETEKASLARQKTVAQKGIQSGILVKISSASDAALKNSPKRPTFKTANRKERALLERGRTLLKAGKSANKWNAARLVKYANQLDDYKSDLEANISAKDNAPDEEKQKATKCKEDYQKCLDENDCEYSFFCLCCVPCVSDYLGCMMWRVVTSGRDRPHTDILR